MPRYLSPEWVESFDAALQALDLTDAIAAAGAGSLAAAEGRFSVVQIVTGVPEDVRPAGGDVHLVLTVAEGRAGLALDPSGAVGGTATIVLAYAQALAMARGELDPADALAAGHVRVRGDLAALVAGQGVLAEAAGQLGDDLEGLTERGAPTVPEGAGPNVPGGAEPPAPTS